MGRSESKALLRLIPVALSVTVVMWLISTASAAVQKPLRLEHVGADSDAAFRVVATIIVGPTESVLWDGQYKVSDGKRLAVAATGTQLKAIVISHADHDHYMGAMEVLKRFPTRRCTWRPLPSPTLTNGRRRNPWPSAGSRTPMLRTRL